MSRFNVATVRPKVAGPILSEASPASVNHEGGSGYARDLKSELFLLAVSNMTGKSTFYETAGARDNRYVTLVRQAALADPQWTAQFLGWLRRDDNLRSASLVGAAEYVKSRLEAGINTDQNSNRSVIASVLQRADEPGEMLAYWTSAYGRAIPKPVKRGIADAIRRLYTEYALLKYDTDSKGFRFADVIDLVHPDASDLRQGELFKHALDRRHNRIGKVYDEVSGVLLPMIVANAVLRATAVEKPSILLDRDLLKDAGMTWEDVLSLAGSKVDKAKLWEALTPTMGYMCLLRNLRGFDEAGVSDEVAERVAARLADPEQVAKSRQFPFRFYAAYAAVKSLRWGHALEKALKASLTNVPDLPGRTLVVVDQSPSMFPGYHFSTPQQNKDITNADLAKLFGTAVALRASDATLVGYGQTSYRVPLAKSDSVLRVMAERFTMVDGTDTFGAVAQYFDRHDRVVIVTDEQNQVGRFRSVDEVVPKNVPVYVWNIGGYAVGSTASGLANRHTFAGLTDHAFRLVPLLEGGRDGSWPWVPTAG